MFKFVCEDWGIDVFYCFKGGKYYGGYIECLIGIIMGLVYVLSGTMYLLLKDKGDYNSE